MRTPTAERPQPLHFKFEVGGFGDHTNIFSNTPMHDMSPFLLLTMLLATGAATAVTSQRSIADEAATFVLESLVEMSDSGIYKESLRVNSINNVSIIDGLYHTNSLFVMELASEHFESGQELENFQVIVMDSKPNANGDENLNGGMRRGYAIDRFPKMKDEQIEAAQSRKVERTVKRNKQIRHEVLNGRQGYKQDVECCQKSWLLAI